MEDKEKMIDVEYSLAKRIKKARKSAGYSQKELGDALELSDKTVSAYEVGRVEPTLEKLKEIGTLTHKPVAYFLEETDLDDLELQIKLKNIERELLEVKKILREKGV